MNNPCQITTAAYETWACKNRPYLPGLTLHTDDCTLPFHEHRVKSDMFGQTAKVGQPLCLFHGSIIGIKIKLTLANSENPDETAHKDR